MKINLTIGGIIAVISAIAVFISFVFQFRGLLKTRFKHEIIFTAILLLFSVVCTLQALAYLLLSIELFHFAVFVVLIDCYLIIYLQDTITRISLDQRKTTIIIIFSVISAIFSFQPNTFIKINYPNGDLGIIINEGYFSIFYYITLSIISAFVIYFSLKIFLKAPKNLKKQSAMYLLSTIVFGAIPVLFSILQITQIIPSLHLLILTFGAILMSLTFRLEPKIAYILPYRVVRLIIINITKGIPIFHHEWIKKADPFEISLYAAMIQAAGKFIENKVKKGSIREIRLDESILILETIPDYPIIFVLETTRFSNSLHNGLMIFAKQFIKEYSQFFSDPSNISQFQKASELIKQCFSFIPNYIL